MTALHQVANFRVKHPNSDIEQARRGIILLVLVFILPVLILIYRFSVKNIVNRPFFSDFLIPPTNRDF